MNTTLLSRPVRKLAVAAAVLAVAAAVTVPGAATAYQVRGAISDLAATSDTPGTIDVDWTAPRRAAPDDYRVRWARSGESWPSWRDATGNLYPTTSSQRITDLDEGVAYKVQVRARYRAGYGWSGPWEDVTATVAATLIATVTTTTTPPPTTTTTTTTPPPTTTTTTTTPPPTTTTTPPPTTTTTTTTPPPTTTVPYERPGRIGSVSDAALGSNPWSSPALGIEPTGPRPPRVDDDPPVVVVDNDPPVVVDDPLVALQQTSGPEPVDYPADATTTAVLIVDGDAASARLVPALDSQGFRTIHDEDWYRVELDEDIHYLFETADVPPLNIIKIFDSDGTQLQTSHVGKNNHQYSYPQLLNKLPFTPDAGGTFYVSVTGLAPGAGRDYQLSARSDDYPADRTTTAVLTVGGSIQVDIMRTRENPQSTFTDDHDWIRVKDLQLNTNYRIVWDVACRHEGIIEALYFEVGSSVPLTYAEIERETDGWCTDLTTVFRPRFLTGDFFISVTARGSDFPNASQYPFMGVVGVLTVTEIPA